MAKKNEGKSVREAFHILHQYDISVKTFLKHSLVYQFTIGLESLFWSILYLKFLLYCVEQQYSPKRILLFFFVIAVIIGMIRYLNGRYELRVRPKLVQTIETNFRKLFYNRIITASILEVESNNYSEKNQKIVRAMQGQIIKFLDDISVLFGKTITTSMVFAIIWDIDKRSLLILIFPICATWVFGELYNKMRYQSKQEQDPGNVRKEYVKKCFFSKNPSAEIRMTHIGRPLTDLYNQGANMVQQCIHKNGKVRIRLAFLFEVFKNRIPFSLILAYAVYQVMVEKRIGVLDISVVLVGLVNLSDGISELIDKYVTLGESKRYIYDFEECMQFYANNQEPQGEKSINELRNEIRFEQVRKWSWKNNVNPLAIENLQSGIRKNFS